MKLRTRNKHARLVSATYTANDLPEDIIATVIVLCGVYAVWAMSLVNRRMRACLSDSVCRELVLQRGPRWLLEEEPRHGVRGLLRACYASDFQFDVEVYNPFLSCPDKLFRNACVTALACFLKGHACSVVYTSIRYENEKRETVNQSHVRRPCAASDPLPILPANIVDGAQVEVQWRNLGEREFNWWYGELKACTATSCIVVFPAEVSTTYRDTLYEVSLSADGVCRVRPPVKSRSKGEFGSLRLLTEFQKHVWKSIVVCNDADTP
jgi:hypothetical protein